MTVWTKKAIITRMKDFMKLTILATMIASLLLSPRVVAEEIILQQSGDTPVDRIRVSCEAVSQNLRRLHTNDSLLRVNIGQIYNSLSVRLMARLNSRLALNRIDSTNLVEITGRFEVELESFRLSYNDYEVALATLIKTNCSSNPTEFYANLLKTRDARSKLAVAVESMNDSVSSYQVEVEQLRQRLIEPKKELSHEG